MKMIHSSFWTGRSNDGNAELWTRARNGGAGCHNRCPFAVNCPPDAVLAQIAERLERIERIMRVLVPRQADPVERDLVAVLADFTGRDWFTGKELWAAISSARRAAEVTGDDAPYLAEAMDDLGITTTRALGWWLSSLDGALIERSAKSRDGLLWRFL